MQFSWTVTEKDAFKILDEYFDFGGNTIDTADMYSNWVEGNKGGEAESVIGRWMKQKKNREKIFLISKVRAKVWEGKDGEGLGSTHIIKAIDKSLKRLKTDYLDLYLSHWPDENTAIEETLSTFKELIKQGKVRSIGCSNYSPSELQHSLEVGKKIGANYSFLEVYYNLIDQKIFEESFLPIVKKHDLQVLTYGPLAGGFLSGIDPSKLKNDGRSVFLKSKMTKENLKILSLLKKIAKKYRATPSQIALAWILKKGFNPIIGVDSLDQLKENMEALNIKFSDEDMEAFDNLT